MKKLSIKLKVTLWYTLFNCILVFAILGFMIIGSKNTLLAQYKEELISSVDDAADEVEYDDGELEIDKDINKHASNITIMVYDQNGEVIYGQLPSIIQEKINEEGNFNFSEGELREIEGSNGNWYVYDYLRTFKKHDPLWIRGFVSVDSSAVAVGSMVDVAMILLPFLVVMAAIGGYFVTKRAFRPINHLNEAITSINDGKDLSKRIDYEGAEDEIYMLTQSFNAMSSRLEEAFNREKQFTSDASHELRTPIAVIKAECEYGLMQKENPEEMQEALKGIMRQSQSMSALVNQLLMLARADRGSIQLQKEKFNLSELMELVMESLEEEAEEKQIQLIGDIPENIQFNGDQTLLMRLFINLIANGIYYGKSNAVTAEEEEGYVKVQMTQTPTEVICQIADNGIGIEADKIPHIWERFYQVNPARSRAREGSSGLGLAMVKWIVEAHDGSVTVESEFGKGSTFEVRLPRREG